jgi:hypothetical protein
LEGQTSRAVSQAGQQQEAHNLSLRGMDTLKVWQSYIFILKLNYINENNESSVIKPPITITIMLIAFNKGVLLFK